MMSDCEDIRELLSARIDDELTEAEARRLEEHLLGCEACRRELAELERVWEGIDVLGQPVVPLDLADRVSERVLASRRRVRRRGFARWAYSLATAAALVAAVVVVHHVMKNDVTDPETRQIVRNIDLLQNLDVLENLEVLEEVGDDVIVLPGDQNTDSGNGDQS